MRPPAHAGSVDPLWNRHDTDAIFDYRFEPRQAVGTEDAYALEWTMIGTNDRADPGRGSPATGRPFWVPWPRRWPGVVAWTLWALAMVACW